MFTITANQKNKIETTIKRLESSQSIEMYNNSLITLTSLRRDKNFMEAYGSLSMAICKAEYAYESDDNVNRTIKHFFMSLKELYAEILEDDKAIESYVMSDVVSVESNNDSEAYEAIADSDNDSNILVETTESTDNNPTDFTKLTDISTEMIQTLEVLQRKEIEAINRSTVRKNDKHMSQSSGVGFVTVYSSDYIESDSRYNQFIETSRIAQNRPRINQNYKPIYTLHNTTIESLRNEIRIESTPDNMPELLPVIEINKPQYISEVDIMSLYKYQAYNLLAIVESQGLDWDTMTLSDLSLCLDKIHVSDNMREKLESFIGNNVTVESTKETIRMQYYFKVYKNGIQLSYMNRNREYSTVTSQGLNTLLQSHGIDKHNYSQLYTAIKEVKKACKVESDKLKSVTIDSYTIEAVRCYPNNLQAVS